MAEDEIRMCLATIVSSGDDDCCLCNHLERKTTMRWGEWGRFTLNIPHIIMLTRHGVVVGDK